MKVWRPQFRLVWLFALVTLCALAVWGYWYGWPAWQNYRERVAFERPALQLRAGMTLHDIEALFGKKCDFHFTISRARNGPTATMPVHMRSYTACVFIVLDQSAEDALQNALMADENPAKATDSYAIPSREIRVYRLMPAPYGYRARSPRASAVAAALAQRKRTQPPTESWTSEHQYMDDFIDHLTGFDQGAVQIESELMHSDGGPTPPQSATTVRDRR